MTPLLIPGTQYLDESQEIVKGKALISLIKALRGVEHEYLGLFAELGRDFFSIDLAKGIPNEAESLLTLNDLRIANLVSTEESSQILRLFPIALFLEHRFAEVVQSGALKANFLHSRLGPNCVKLLHLLLIESHHARLDQHLVVVVE